MSCKIVSAGNHSSFHTKPNLHTPKTFLAPCSHLTFNTHLPRQSLSLRTQFRSTRNPVIKAAVSDLNVTTDSLYDLLGISETGTLSDIKHAYRQLARKYHPDVSPPDRTEEYTKKFIQVQEAYETLSDPNTRALYDRDMIKGLHLAFSAIKPFHYKEVWNEGGDWEQIWQSQLSELQRMRDRDGRDSSSWGARMRAQAKKKNCS
ncbi:hypothetical protein K2173_018298 [Erythroxylum novogranatense]|uniref:J domain-containing protein n=1 Tax=Erythroxylum novogranatense TaxID=1862640 RepID=A0AAV8UA57_9ROSI|nr:hypothetical protein K2173_018298 [Erythroxylum novogranatense]